VFPLDNGTTKQPAVIVFLRWFEGGEASIMGWTQKLHHHCQLIVHGHSGDETLVKKSTTATKMNPQLISTVGISIILL